MSYYHALGNARHPLDLDGTLVDSLGSVVRSWRAPVVKLGCPWAEIEPVSTAVRLFKEHLREK